MNLRKSAGGLFRYANPLLPFLRVKDQIQESAGRINELRKKSSTAVLDQERAKAILAGKDPAQMFEELYEANGWTPEALRDQLAVVRLTRVAGIISIAVLLGLLVLAVIKASALVLPFALLAIGLGLVLQFGNVVIYGKRQAEIEQRRFLTGREYLSRPDLMRHMFSIRSRGT